MGGKRRTRKRKKKINSALAERKKASQKIGTVRGAEGSPGVGSFNKKFLAPTAFRLGNSQVMFTDRQRSLGKARDGKKSTNHKRAHSYSPWFQSARLKKQTNKNAVSQF